MATGDVSYKYFVYIDIQYFLENFDGKHVINGIAGDGIEINIYEAFIPKLAH